MGNEKLKQAVTNWIKAEWAFRLGPCAYLDHTAEHYMKAEAKLRRALTERGELKDAFEALKEQDEEVR